jgi:hypothetical protein
VTRRILTAALIFALGVGAASCAGVDQRESAADQVRAWVQNTGFGEDIGTLVADNARISEEKTTPAMHNACATMEIDAETANQELPIHNEPRISGWLSTAYGLEGTAATECYDAGVTNQELLAKAERNGAKAQALFSRALIAIQSVDGRLPTTTTTTDNTPGNILG